MAEIQSHPSKNFPPTVQPNTTIWEYKLLDSKWGSEYLISSIKDTPLQNMKCKEYIGEQISAQGIRKGWDLDLIQIAHLIPQVSVSHLCCGTIIHYWLTKQLGFSFRKLVKDMKATIKTMRYVKNYSPFSWKHVQHHYFSHLRSWGRIIYTYSYTIPWSRELFWRDSARN